MEAAEIILPGQVELEIQAPQNLMQFNGQTVIKEELGIYIESANIRRSRMDHVLFQGPPGVGKTTLAEIISRELGVNMRQLTAPMIEKPSDIVHVLAGLDERDVLFIDEIHRLNIRIAELFYPVMQDFRLDVIIGGDADGRVESIPLPPFTLIGATTHSGKLPKPLLDRFHIQLTLELYTDEEMALVVPQSAGKLNLELTPKAVSAVIRCSRGTPRIANAILNRIRDHATVQKVSKLEADFVEGVLSRLGYDKEGFSKRDRLYIRMLKDSTRPMGLKTLAASLNIPEETIENEIEPYLLRKNIVIRTERGRTLSKMMRNPFSQLAQTTMGF